MAFDVYVGTLTRFYTGDWDNVGQRWARSEGVSYQMIHTGGEPEPPAPAADVRAAVMAWRDAINQGLAGLGHGALQWSEEDDQPYFTDRPAWEGYSGLLLWAAYAHFPSAPLPYALPQSWADDTMYQKVMAAPSQLRYPVVLSANLWLPGDFRLCFDCPSFVSEDRSVVASTGALVAELRQLRTERIRWRTPSVLSHFKKARNEISLERAAHSGLAAFAALAEKAHEHQLPILLSF
jgi:hypothetical protein